MRLGVLSDVHGNLPALEVALGELARAGVDRYLCAGDVVGYGPYPNECVERIAALDAVCVAGNHDLVAIGRADCDRCGELARRTLRWTGETLSPSARRWLESLPLEATLGRVLVTHAALGDPWRYLTTIEAAVDELERVARCAPDVRQLIVGHTHHPMALTRSKQGVIERRDATVALAGPDPWLLNPGSVGQSRERRALVRFLVLDLAAGTATFGAAPYDLRRCRRALRLHGLPAEACHRRPRPVRWRLAAARGRVLGGRHR